MNSFDLSTNSGIYKLACSATKQFYIGSSKNVINRWGSHIEDLRKGTHCNYRLQRDFDQFGESTFNFEIIYVTDRHIPRGDLIMLEQGYIDTSKPFYNITKNLGLNPIGPKYEKKSKIFKKKKRKSSRGKTRNTNSTFGI